ncbi:hypothetical protein J4Q44_G00264550 [Coregonus suidteri]|uniref:Uncharacterized protein n=1 Tax=Coregonus suidteri TaxID=861788 RepID=A0AAN8LHX5_9TELE
MRRSHHRRSKRSRTPRRRPTRKSDTRNNFCCLLNFRSKATSLRVCQQPKDHHVFRCSIPQPGLRLPGLVQ